MGVGGNGDSESAVIKPLTITKNGTYEAGVGGDTLTWDGNTEGREYIDLGASLALCKVYDDIPQSLSMGDIVGVTYVIKNSGETSSVEGVYYSEDGVLGVVVIEGDLTGCMIVSSDYLLEGVTFTKGIYFAEIDDISIRSLTIPGYTGFSDGADGYSPIDVNVTPNLQEKTATENGEVVADEGYDGLSKVVVNVESSGGGDLDALIDGSITEISSNAERVTAYAFYRQSALKSAVFPNATSVSNYAFENCTNLTDIDLPKATRFYDDVFRNCTNLTTVNAPNVTIVGSRVFNGCNKLANIDISSVTSIGDYAFENCTNLTDIDLPNVTNMSSGVFSKCSSLANIDLPKSTSIGSALFSNCTKLTTVNAPNATMIDNYAFSNCGSLKSVILRGETMCTLSSTYAFNNCTNISNGTGYIYVPRALVDTYKSATNWTTFADQFRALEDYTVDGTITGALDESKI